ncbi:Tyrosine recombinase XerC [subsurface metagenome]
MVTETRTLTLSQLVGRFLSSRRDLSPKTLKYYGSILANFEWYAGREGWTEAESITRENIRDFLAYVETESYRWPGMRRCACKPASRGTIHHYGKVVKTLFNWAEEEEYLDKNPALRLRLGPPKYKQVEPYSDEEVKAMLDVCIYDGEHRYRYLGVRNLAIISLLADTGLRVSELGGIKLSDLDPNLRQLRVLGKGAKMRVVPVDGEARKALKRYLNLRPPEGDELWKTDHGQSMSTYSIKVMIQRLKKRAGVNGYGGAHRLRHYFATRYLEAGGNLNSLRLLLGHATLDMVLRYSKYADAQKALDEHQAFSPLDRLYNGRPKNNGERWGYRG